MADDGSVWVKVYPEFAGGSGPAVVSGATGAVQTTETWGDTTYTVYTFTDPITTASVALTDEAKEQIADEDIFRAVADATDPADLIAEYGDVLKDALIVTPMSDPGHSITISEAGLATVLLVAGGGGSGNDASGGGGGVTPLTMMLDAGTIAVGVGDGGIAGNTYGTSANAGKFGGASYIGRVAAGGGGGGAGAAVGVEFGGQSMATGGGGGRSSPSGTAILGPQGYSAYDNGGTGYSGAGGAAGPGTGATQDAAGPGYIWIDGVTYGAGGLKGGSTPTTGVLPGSGNGGYVPAGTGSSGIVIVAVEV
jgi:hypothetical protein